MGNIVGGLIGGVGSLLGAGAASSSDLTGYNYLKGANASAVNNGQAASNASAQLLGTAPITSQTQNGFNNYLNSTGYQFAKQQGQTAINGSASARGLRDSGDTAKALQTFGQGLAGQSFNNYLGQLNTQSGQGITAAGQVGSAGTSGGTAAGGAAQSGVSKAGGIFGGIATDALGLMGI